MSLAADPPPASHLDLLSRWRTYADVSRALERKGLKISGMGVARWAQNDSIPGPYWHPLAMLADEARYMAFVQCLEMLARHAYDCERLAHEKREREAANDAPAADPPRPHDAEVSG